MPLWQHIPRESFLTPQRAYSALGQRLCAVDNSPRELGGVLSVSLQPVSDGRLPEPSQPEAVALLARDCG